ncbi:DUF1423 domain-containing protein [Cephalotus follicularis]|uniref:DUF1423 domain-containing protein n=1 Tax=Cephalotus follicularis TaxID=3775 RepID=A0A1Q3ANH9_CEPFO|nr:DUF1423 domain-containing protein [Cephalotus follicularis]
MFGDKDLSNSEGESSKQNKQKLQTPEDDDDEEEDGHEIIMSFPQKKGFDFLKDIHMGGGGGGGDCFPSKSTEELTLSYLCENPKLGSSFFSEKNLLMEIKGKQVVVSDDDRIPVQQQDHDKWVERDFLNLNETKHRGRNTNSSKRQIVEELEEEELLLRLREKKPKLETLNLSLALPDVSLSLTTSKALKPKPSQSIQSLAPSNNNNNTQTACSNDCTAASMSYSYSLPYSHNPSCSLTRNSTDNFGDDQIWCGGEGTNGSVHSRFRPIGEGLVTFNNPSMMQGNRALNTNSNVNNSLYRTPSSDNQSFYPSELPARPRIETHSDDSRRRENDNMKVLESLDGMRPRKLSPPERILRELVSESVPVMSQIILELSDETLESTKEHLQTIISLPEKREDLVALQSRLERRTDLTKEILSRCQRDHLEILNAIKMGLGSFVTGKIRLPTSQLVEIFLFMRCRNVNCKSILPVDDCDCKICSTNKGFCSSCMCPVCLKFDCASNTCSWVGCDVCSHWCHAACGIQKNLIKPGPSLNRPLSTSGMQFHCIGCGHASEMFGFVKDVFICCAKDWGLDSLKKELDCLTKIFRGSDDVKGKQLHVKGDELLLKLERKVISPSDACNCIIQFFNYLDDMPDFPASDVSSKDLIPSEASLKKYTRPMTQLTSSPPKHTIYNMSSSIGQRNLLSNDLHQKAALLRDLKIEDGLKFGQLPKKDGFDSLESIVRIKEAEAKMFQSKADDAQREADGIRRMILFKSDKLEEEYAEKLAKLCLKETEERRRLQLEELKVLENSHCEYYNMKLRMQAEIAGLLERMEATKQQWV